MTTQGQPQDRDGSGDLLVTHTVARTITIHRLDQETTELVRLSAVLTCGSEPEIRARLTSVHALVNPEWIEELILQTYLFAGFPRALNAAREWRRVSGRRAPARDESLQVDEALARRRGEATCATVYGPSYARLRVNIKALHPALDAWMIDDGYGKVLGRPQLDLARRELCVVATCAVARQDRQLHSHLHGARYAGASDDAVADALHVVEEFVNATDILRYRALWARIRGK